MSEVGVGVKITKSCSCSRSRPRFKALPKADGGKSGKSALVCLLYYRGNIHSHSYSFYCGGRPAGPGGEERITVKGRADHFSPYDGQVLSAVGTSLAVHSYAACSLELRMLT